MTQPTTPDDEYGFIDSALAVFANWDCSYENVEGWEEIQIKRIKAAKQQIISYIQQNYTPNGEVERLKREAVSKSKYGHASDEDLKELIDNLQHEQRRREQLSNKEDK